MQDALRCLSMSPLMVSLNRPHWIPYFDDVQAIIFLAPLAFNLMLEEDSRVNRLVCNIFVNGMLAF
ncbi:hypothetical protein EIP86_005263 [Pleurotus ostreatoroseus]|nr:hypothetical protein EIP86_005263 [Pleurotus ostreatoroseus]